MAKKFKWDNRIVQSIEMIFDLGIVVLSLLAVLYVHEDLNNLTIVDTLSYIVELVITNGILLVFTFIFFRVYKVSVIKSGFLKVIPNMALALLMANILTAFASLFLNNLEFSRTMFIYTFFIQMAFFIVTKYFAAKFFRRVNIKTAIVIGPEDQANDFAKKLLLESERYIKVKYLVYEKKERKNQLEEIYELIDNVDYVYITANLFEKKKNAIISNCIEKQKTFYLVPKIYELAIKNAAIDQIGDVLAYEVRSMDLSIENRFLKRSFDLIVSIIGLFFTAPILLITAIAIKISDGGPIFFIQERLTYKNKKFKVIKFRTMIVDAEKHTGPVLATENDPRITKIGRFMRKTRIDELPQFFNILAGDMSIVGPRPEREFFVKQFSEENDSYKYRMNVKAGVTGLAQALGKYNTSFEDKLRFDLYYIRNYSIFHDLYILLHTVRAVVDEDSAQGITDDMTIDTILDKLGMRSIENDECTIQIIEK